MCKADWTGKPIPEEDRQYFGGKTHFSKKILIYDADEDRTVSVKCPECGIRFSC
jgi:hypothetical protein